MSADGANPFDTLLEKSREIIPGLDANRRMFELRQQMIDEYGSVVMYEVVLASCDPDNWRPFIARELPKLAEQCLRDGGVH